MADITIESSTVASMNNDMQPRSLVWTDKDTGYAFFVDIQSDTNYRKTTDGGATWGSAVSVKDGATTAVAIWYDGWTDGDTGKLIHVAYLDNEFSAADILYRTIDTGNSDTLGTELTVFDGASAVVDDWTDHCISVTKSRNGNIFVGGRIDISGENGFWKGDADPVTSFSSKTTVWDSSGSATGDRIQLLYGNEADTDDVWCVYHDSSANAITLKVYDDSANTWSESSSIHTCSEVSDWFHFDSTQRHSDGHALIAMWSKHNTIETPDPDLSLHDVTDISTFSEKTAPYSGDSKHGICGIMINQQNDDIYVTYSTGTTTGSIKYKKSTDGGTTWGSESALSVTSDDHRLIYGGTSVGDDGGRFAPCWYNDDLDDLVTNADNSVEIAAASVGGSTNFQINISDAWKEVAGIQINIGDAWKTVAGAQVNIGDAWKTIY